MPRSERGPPGWSSRPTTRPRTSRRSSPRRWRSCPPAARVLIVDDSSPDGTGEIADRLAAERRRRRASCTGRARKASAPPTSPASAAALAGGRRAGRSRWTPTSPTTRPTCRGCSRPPSGADLVLGSRYVAGRRRQRLGAAAAGDQPRRQRLRPARPRRRGPRPDRRLQVLPPRGAGGDRPRLDQRPRLRLPGRDDLPRDPARLPRGRGADRLPRPPASAARR